MDIENLSNETLIDALTAFTADRSPENRFRLFKELCDSTLIVPVMEAPETEVSQITSEILHGAERFDLGEAALPEHRMPKIQFIAENGTYMLPAFSDGTSLLNVFPEGSRCILLDGTDLLQLVPRYSVELFTINPLSGHALEIPVAEIQKLMQMLTGLYS